jgi:hypothetical protein
LIALFLVARVTAFLLWKTVFVWVRPKVYPQPERPQWAAPVYSDYGTFQLATARWSSAKQLFENNETARLAGLSTWASKGGPLSTIAFVVGIVATISAAQHGAGAGWGTGIGGLMILGMVVSAEENFRRWRHQALFVRQEFGEPEPVYLPPEQPSPRDEPPLLGLREKGSTHLPLSSRPCAKPVISWGYLRAESRWKP